MSKEVKFTSDGRKVVVIGSLNSQEKIVQEIFIADGSEIPSGEHFVTKSLHDAPAISWKEQELKKIEERYEKDRRKYETEIDDLKKSHRQKSQELRAKLNYIGLALKNANEKSFETLVDYITGEIEWVVVNHYDLQLLPISEFNQMYEDRLRLISIFGKDDGSFTYAVGDYYDFSGGNKKFIPFKNYEDALSVFEILVIDDGVSEKNIAIAKKYGFEFPVEKVLAWKKEQTEQLNKNIFGYEKKILEWQSSIDRLLDKSDDNK
jgi:flagellar biosynthesis regulator FlaF